MKNIFLFTFSAFLVACSIQGTATTIFAETSGDWKYTTNGTSATITGYTGADTAISIPYKIDQYAVTSIGSSTFAYNMNLTSINLPRTITTIGSRAFWSCRNLTSINIPDDVTSIGSGAFNDCRSLPSITIPDSVKSIESNAFSGCESLTYLAIPNGVKYIRDNAFSNCTNLVSLTIPRSVTSIASSAFSNCSKLVIYCNFSSFTEVFAKYHKLNFSVLDAPNVLPRIIKTPQELADIKNDLAGNYILGNDIDLSSYNNGVWIPIGEPFGSGSYGDEAGDFYNSFTGTLDGNGHKIVGLNIPASENRIYAGVFGVASGATIKNLGVEIKKGGRVAGTCAGGIVGLHHGFRYWISEYGTYSQGVPISIMNCWVDGDIIGTGSTGGLIGSSNVTEISDSHTTGNVFSESSAGGLIGSCFSGISADCSIIISNCASSANVSSTDMSGGLIGDGSPGGEFGWMRITIRKSCSTGTIRSYSDYNDDSVWVTAGGLIGHAYSNNGNETFIDDSYSSGNIIGQGSAGGIIGAQWGNLVEMNNCYSFGSLVSQKQVGGLIGHHANCDTLIMDNCFWSSDAAHIEKGEMLEKSDKKRINVMQWTDNGTEMVSDAINSLSSSEMRIQQSFRNWDFENVWSIDPTSNGGLPYLQNVTYASTDATYPYEIFSVTRNGEFLDVFVLSNNLLSNMTADLIACFYVDELFAELKITKTRTDSFLYSIKSPKSATKVKFLIWDSIGNTAPLSRSVVERLEN